MEIDALRLAIEKASFASVSIGFLIGLLFSFNPVALAAIPVSLGYVTRAREKKTALVYAGMFILGLIFTHAMLGFIAGLGGNWVSHLLGRFWGAILGPLLILLGLIWAGWVRLPLPTISFRAKRASNVWGAFSLGIPFSIAVCPFCTAALIVILGVVATTGSPLLGATVLSAFALGRSLPIALGAWAIGSLRKITGRDSYQRVFEMTGSVVLMLSGFYLLNAYFFIFPDLAI